MIFDSPHVLPLVSTLEGMLGCFKPGVDGSLIAAEVLIHSGVNIFGSAAKFKGQGSGEGNCLATLGQLFLEEVNLILEAVNLFTSVVHFAWLDRFWIGSQGLLGCLSFGFQIFQPLFEVEAGQGNVGLLRIVIQEFAVVVDVSQVDGLAVLRLLHQIGKISQEFEGSEADLDAFVFGRSNGLADFFGQVGF